MTTPLLIPIAFKYLEHPEDSSRIILSADIGGTKANLMLSRFSTDGLQIIKENRYICKDYQSFNDILGNFLEGETLPDNICFSVAGPVIEGKVKFTNLSWQLDINEISTHAGGSPVAIINDLEATAYGLAALKKEELSILCKGANQAPGNIAILAAGTGLGEAGLFFDGNQYHPFATEGGHSDFAPRSERDIAVLTFLLARHEHVSWERLLSGNGIYTIWQFLTQVEKKKAPHGYWNKWKIPTLLPLLAKQRLRAAAWCV